ncbi:Cyclin-related protein fam58a [Dirofilaria immitis]|nr:Cyclin-related protein fam58a [Dirofilaria immitis]
MLIVGDRIEAGGNRGVIKYIGAVDGYDGEWIGIDWDNPERGKHDGFLNGKRYFQANSAKSGSFVRPTAVNAGRNLLEEMNNRYINYKQCDVIEFGSKNVDLVNMAKIYEKQNNLWELRVIAIDNMKVAKAPPTSCALFKYCTELNLYNNLLSQWCDLLDILCFFPSLRFLIAGRNYMEREMKSVVDKRIVSAPITILALGECRIDENTARKIMHFFPHVREIHLDRNDLKCFDPGEYGRNLESIDLEGNPINDFANLHVLSTLPKQKQWISELAKFSKLERLCYSCSDNDNADFGIDLREIIIASIPQLKFLGNSEISSVERHSAEIRFLNKFGASPMTEENRSIVKRLIEVHGQPIDSSFMPCGGMDLLKLRLSYDGKIVERSLPTTVTVQRLIGIVSRLFHLDARKISLQVCDCHGFMMNLDKPSRSLDFYSLSDGNTIYATITIASACLLLAAKIEEDEIVKTRDVVNVAYSVLHPRAPILQIDDDSWALRTSLSRMEYIVLRLLKFRLAVENPHKYLLHYISSLMHWCPHEFTKFNIGSISFIILRDAHVNPDWVLSHSPQTIAIVCLAVALRITKISIGVRWYSIFYSSMTKSKLRRLEEELVTVLKR